MVSDGGSVGESRRENGMDGERKKVCLSIKRLSRRLVGIHRLFSVLLLVYELSDTQQKQQQKCLSLLLYKQLLIVCFCVCILTLSLIITCFI